MTNSIFNDLQIKDTAKVKYPEDKIILNVLMTNKPLFTESEIISVVETTKDKRAYKNMYIILEPTAKKMTSFNNVTSTFIKLYKEGGYQDLGDNYSLYYCTLEPLFSLMKRGGSKE